MFVYSMIQRKGLPPTVQKRAADLAQLIVETYDSECLFKTDMHEHFKDRLFPDSHRHSDLDYPTIIYDMIFFTALAFTSRSTLPLTRQASDAIQTFQENICELYRHCKDTKGFNATTPMGEVEKIVRRRLVSKMDLPHKQEMSKPTI